MNALYRIAGALLLLLAGTLGSEAQTATVKTQLNNTSWANLGAGPLLLSPNGQVVYAVSDSTPTIPNTEGFPLQNDVATTVNTLSNVWAMAVNATPTYVYNSPILAGGGSSGGGGTGGTVNQGTGGSAPGWLIYGSPALATAPNQTAGNTLLQTIANNTGASVPAGSNIVGYNSNDPCTYSKKSFAHMAYTTVGTATNVISAPGAGVNIYICGILGTTSAQTHFNLISSTTTACGGTPTAVFGNTTATLGPLIGPGVSTAGGFAFGNGIASVGATAAANSYVCSLFDTTNAPSVEAEISYVATTN